MNLPLPQLPKPRSDSTIDSRLDSLQADLFFERLENGLSLREGVAWLLADHGVTLSEMSLSRWAAKRRQARTDAAFTAALETLRADRVQAAATAALDGQPPEEKKPDPAAEFAQASLLLANHALFVAQRDGKDDQIAKAVRNVTALERACLQRQRAQASAVAAERTFRRQAFAAFKAVADFERRDHFGSARQASEDLRAVLFDFIGPWPNDGKDEESEPDAEHAPAKPESPAAPKSEPATPPTPGNDAPAAPEEIPRVEPAQPPSPAKPKMDFHESMRVARNLLAAAKALETAQQAPRQIRTSPHFAASAARREITLAASQK